MNAFDTFTFEGRTINLYGNATLLYILCTDIFVTALGHRTIQDSHIWRNLKLNPDYFHANADGVWYFTRTGLTHVLKHSHKPNAKPLLAAFEQKLK